MTNKLFSTKEPIPLFEKLILIINIPRFIIGIIMIMSCGKGNLEITYADVMRWGFRSKLGGKWGIILYLLSFYKEFRNLMIYRIRKRSVLLSYFFRIIYPPSQTLYIHTEKIGKGLFIQHGFATIIAAKEIGEYCHINQQVTIGFKGKDAPTIGNRVVIYAGAIVVGDVTLGDHCIVGAGAVVTKDVPPGAVVVGNPARIIRYVEGYSEKG